MSEWPDLLVRILREDEVDHGGDVVDNDVSVDEVTHAPNSREDAHRQSQLGLLSHRSGH